MSDAYIGEIRVFGFNFAPVGWMQCNGQTLAISQYSALFSIIGTYYGGNGQTTFQLPNFQGNAPMDAGNGPGLTPRAVGETAGESQVTLTVSAIPAHNHTMNAYQPQAGTDLVSAPAANSRLSEEARTKPGLGALKAYSNIANPNTTLASTAVTVTGQSQPHPNAQPYLVLNFCICINGIFPSRG